MTWGCVFASAGALAREGIMKESLVARITGRILEVNKLTFL
jgi:hypothetical protein